MRKKIQYILFSDMSVYVVTMLFTLYLATVYGATFLGVFILYSSILSMSLMISKLGLFFSLEKKASEINGDLSRIISSVFILNSILLLITVTLMFLFKDFIEIFIGYSEIIYFLIFTLFSGNFTNLNYSILKSQKDFKVYGNLKLQREIIFRLLAIILLLIEGSFYSILFAKLIAELISFLQSLFYVFKHRIVIKKPNISIMKDLVKLARYNAILEIRALTFSWADIWMIGIFMEQKFVGIYQTAWQISTAVLMLGKAIITVIFPYLSSWSSQMNFKKVKESINKLVPFILLIPIPAFLGSLIMTNDLLSIFGSEFEGGEVVLSILLLCSIFRGLQELFSKILVAINLARFSYYTSIVAGILNIILNFFLISNFGIEGAAVATTISTFLNFILCYWYVKMKIGIYVDIKAVLKNVFSSIIMLLILYIFKFILNIDAMSVNLFIGILTWLILMGLLNYNQIRNKSINPF